MAVRIIGEAPLHVKQCTCRKCAAKLEYTLADCKVGKQYDYTGPDGSAYILTCPRCGHQINCGNAY